MFEKLNYIKTEGDLMDIQCREIEGNLKFEWVINHESFLDKIKLTATKISSSMTSLNQLIDSKQKEHKVMNKVNSHL